MAPEPPGASSAAPLELLVGVMSFRSPIALARRQAMRSMLRPVARCALRFVLSSHTPDKDASLSDVLSFRVNESSRILGTYLLNNAFFRYAVTLRPALSYIARADDDSFFDMGTVLAEMRAASSCRAFESPPSCKHDVVYGDFKEWYMWSPRSMQATCFDFGYGRHQLALKRLDDVRGDASKLPRFQRECLHADASGPFPFAKGPLVGFSYSVADRIVRLPELAADEVWALGDRKRVPLRNVVSGTLHEPRRAVHPRKAIVFDDIYFGYLCMRAIASAPLLLVNAHLSEFDKSIPERFDKHGARIYHKLKTAERFGMLNKSAAVRMALQKHVRTRFKCSRRARRESLLDAWQAMIAYNADDAALHGAISHWPAAEHPPGSTREIYSWDLGRRLGSIPQPKHTYNVMGNANCQGLVIGETTLGGLSALSNVGKDYRNGTILDYGQLIWVTLQRAATAREAIDVMADLTSKYGYASDMEGFSLADASGEVWYMELIGKGSFEKGAIYVALRVPDGHVAAHANQARITSFLPCDDPSTCRSSKDVVSFAIKHGYWKGAADGPAFSFSDVYDPLTFGGARFCEARVWHIFRSLASAESFNATEFLPYAQGFNLSKRMPLFVKPAKKLTRDAVHALMSHHFQGTWFDPATDIGAGAELSPYRWNGLEWKSDGKSYVNERIVGTHYTAWHFVAQIRPPPVPSQLAARLHWGADDHSWSPKIPVYGGASAVHPSYDDANCTGRDACRSAAKLPGTVTAFSMDSAWWVAQIVADQVYGRKARAAPIVLQAREQLEAELDALAAAAEKEATPKYIAGDVAGGEAVLNRLALTVGGKATAAWAALWQRLIVTFVDGKVMSADPSNEVCGCKKRSATFGDEWKRKVVKDAGAHYAEPTSDAFGPNECASCHGAPTRDKLSIRGVAP